MWGIARTDGKRDITIDHALASSFSSVSACALRFVAGLSAEDEGRDDEGRDDRRTERESIDDEEEGIAVDATPLHAVG